MSHLPLTTPLIQSAETTDQGAHSQGPHRWSPTIHILNNDVLLNVFRLYKPALVDKDEVDNTRILQGGDWGRERWWQKLVHVCRRWRYLVFDSASHLDLCLVCTYGTPVADMLVYSPRLPLIIDYVDEDRDVTAEDEEGIILALRHRDRVRRIRLQTPISSLQKFLVAIEDSYPVLEYLYIAPPTMQDTSLKLSKTFQAPLLRHLILVNLAFPIKSPLLTTAVGLVTLMLQEIHPSVYFGPNDLLQRLSVMHHLDTLGITFHSPTPTRTIQRELFNTPITTHITLPNLRWFGFRGPCAYLEALLPRMTAPLLEKLQVGFFNQLIFSVPHLLQFMRTKEHLKLSNAKISFHEEDVFVTVYPREEVKMLTLYLEVGCRHLDWQVSSAAQIFTALSPVFSAVVDLTLDYREHSLSSEWHNEADHAQWREFLGSFDNVRTLRVHKDLVEELSRSLLPDDGEVLLGLLPELEVLEYSTEGDDADAFSAFVDARRVAGRPVSLIRR